MSSELPVCKNCGAVLESEFCGACGQRGKEVRRPVIGLAQDVLIDTLAIDSKLLRSFGLLLLWPGRLARHYLDGKRMSHTAPFRMYLFTSLFYFLALFTSVSSELNGWHPDENGDLLDGGSVELEDENLPPGVRIGQGSADTEAPEAPVLDEDSGADDPGGELIPGDVGDLAGDPLATDAEPDQEDQEATEDQTENRYNTGHDALDAIGPRMEEAMKRISQDPRLFIAQLKENVPRIMLAAPLIYGLLLAIAYIYRRKFYFYDHLVVSLYMHSALYAYLLITLTLSWLPAGLAVAWVPIAWGTIQPFAVLKQAYGSPWYSVLIKGVAINSIYLLAVILLIIFGLGYSVYLS